MEQKSNRQGRAKTVGTHFGDRNTIEEDTRSHECCWDHKKLESHLGLVDALVFLCEMDDEPVDKRSVKSSAQ